MTFTDKNIVENYLGWVTIYGNKSKFIVQIFTCSLMDPSKCLSISLKYQYFLIDHSSD